MSECPEDSSRPALSAELAGPGQRVRAGFVVTLCLSMGIGPLMIYGLTAMSPLVISELDLTRAQFGTFATVGFAVSAVTSGLVGRLVDAYSERVTMFVLYGGSAAALLGAALSRSYLGVVAAVVLSGAVQALSNPVTNRLISTHVTAGARGLLMGVKQSGVQMMQFLASLTLPALALLLGWRGALAGASAMAVVGLLISARSLPRDAAGRWRRTVTGSRTRLPVAVWWLTAYGMLSGAALQASNVYLPLYGYEVLGLPLPVAALTAAVVGGVGLVARIGWGRATDRIRSPRMALLVLSSVAAVGGLGIFLAGALHTPALLWTGAAVFGGTGIAANVVLMAVVVRLTPLDAVGRASGVLSLGLYLGFAIGPVSFGALVDATQNYGWGWVAVTALYLATAVLVLVGRYETEGSQC